MDTIKCPHCSKSFEITKALKDELESHVQEEIAEKLKKEFELPVKIAREEKEEEHKRAEKFQNEIIELSKVIRKERQEKDDMRLEMEKKLREEQDKIRETARKEALEENELKNQEKDKKLSDALKQVEELKSKIQQGSQQTQGEVLELELERQLREEFPNDLIREVPKGIRGADLIQVVVDKYGRECGTIIWELKNAKWSDGWIPKLRDDQRVAKANVAVIVSKELPKNIQNFAFCDGVWVSEHGCHIGLAYALRMNLGQLYMAKISQVGKNEKMESLYNYLIGTEFRHRVEAIVEAFTNMQSDLEKEKRWFALKWAKEEKDLRKLIDNTHSMYGDLQSIIGTQALPQFSGLELEDGKES